MLADLGLLIVRIVVGALVIGHGRQKLAGDDSAYPPFCRRRPDTVPSTDRLQAKSRALVSTDLTRAGDSREKFSRLFEEFRDQRATIWPAAK